MNSSMQIFFVVSMLNWIYWRKNINEISRFLKSRICFLLPDFVQVRFVKFQPILYFLSCFLNTGSFIRFWKSIWKIKTTIRNSCYFKIENKLILKTLV
jgi:hypothetical protein